MANGDRRRQLERGLRHVDEPDESRFAPATTEDSGLRDLTMENAQMDRKRILFVLPLMFGLILADACSMAAPPTIRVSIGMTVDELKAGSTYQFKDEAPSFQFAPGQKVRYLSKPNLHDWVIAEPYNLIFVYKGHELRKDDIGGSNYLIAITTAPMSQKIVDHIQITFQSHALTLDEALAETKKLNVWFVQAGFHPYSTSDPEPVRVADLFHIEEKERHAPKYDQKLKSYSGIRAAFLDPHAQIIDITPFELEADDAYVGLEISNARRKRENGAADKDESGVATEREYFLDLSISARPVSRYHDNMP